MDPVIYPSDKPIVQALRHSEIEIRSQDVNIRPLRVLRGTSKERMALARFTPTDEQRKCIAEGADIYLSIYTYGEALQPVMLFTGTELDEASVVEEMQLVPCL